MLDASYVEGENMKFYSMKTSKIVALIGLPTSGLCSVCGSEWAGDFSFFDGLALAPGWPSLEDFDHLRYFSSFLGKTKLPWLAQMLRYLLRPQVWFAQHLQEVAHQSLSSPNKTIPKPFASLHVRYGEKVLEVGLIPLSNYMEVVSRKSPHIRHIFVSTETESVIHNLTRYMKI
jgi:hypothetical protein